MDKQRDEHGRFIKPDSTTAGSSDLILVGEPTPVEALNAEVEKLQFAIAERTKKVQTIRLKQLEDNYKAGIRRKLDPEKKVCIVGFAESSRYQVPFHRKDFQIWGLNELYRMPWKPEQGQPRWDRWFELHRLDMIEWTGRSNDHQQQMARMPWPVIMLGKHPDMPNSVPYPIDVVASCFPGMPRRADRYFSNSISYMIALAMIEGFSEIRIYGVDMAQDSEYAYERPSCEYWIGVAYGLGIKVFLPDSSDMLQVSHLYGFGDAERYDFSCRIKDRIGEFTGRRDQHAGQRNIHEAETHKLTGAIEAYQFLLRNYGLNMKDAGPKNG